MRCSDIQKTRQLVTLAKDGDGSALDQLCRVYSERVRWMMRFRMNKEVRSKLESTDLAQDALIHALQGLGDFTYKNEGDFIRWLSKIAQNAFLDNVDKLYADKRDIRKEIPFRASGQNTGDRLLGVPVPIETTTPSVIMSKREDLAKLEKAIDALKPEYREVIVLTKIEGLSYKEIGQRLGKSSDAIRKLVSRAMTAMISAFERI
ncbi:MAG: sigma-70 family RNA polymerase sigma factor [Planctomycetota bacterium]